MSTGGVPNRVRQWPCCRWVTWITLLFFLVFFCRGTASGLTQEFTYFPGTESELKVYKIQGERKGNTLLIIGGIQGNEPGGYLAADLYVDMSLREGTLIVVPRANFSSIVKDVRGVKGDMNRKFASVSREDSDHRIVDILRELIAESDYLLNLHDGAGFYSERWESPMRNPKQCGQSIITDCEQYYAPRKDRVLPLGDMARRVCEAVNAQIENKEYHFSFNNHRTLEPTTLHAEQRTSATFYALTQHEIPAFGIETSKQIGSYELRVKFQTMVINAFMKEFGIIPEHPRIYLDPPQLNYLVLTINDTNPTVVYDGQTLSLREGDYLEISHIEANYERGLSVDVVGVGGTNDYRKRLQISSSTDVIVKKDKFNCGRVSLFVTPASPSFGQEAGAGVPGLDYLIVEVNHTPQVVKRDGYMKVVRGGLITITDALSTPRVAANALKVNFKGFVANPLDNRGEDRGYAIDTAKDLWKRYSVDGKGMVYPIITTYGEQEVGRVWVELVEPQLDYLIVRLNGGMKMCFAPPEVIRARYGDVLEIVDLKTTIEGNTGVTVNFRGFVHDSGEDDRGRPIVLDDTLPESFSLNGDGQEYEIVVERGATRLGALTVSITPPTLQQHD